MHKTEQDGEFTHKWIGVNFLPERNGQLCKILIKSKHNRDCLLEFEDGYVVRSNVALIRRV